MGIQIIDNKSKKLSAEEIPADENVRMVRSLLDQAGHIGRGPGMELIGYGVVFYYKGKWTNSGEFRCHSEVKMLSEVSANDGFKALGTHIAKKYGRKA